MRSRRFFVLGLTLALAAAASTWGWQEPPVAPGAVDDADVPRIRFNFKDASFDQVIDYFSRWTGLSVVWEAEAPAGTLSYLSPEAYEIDEAMHVLNIILQSRGVMLRRSQDMLYLQKLEEMAREDIPTYVGEIPAEVTPDQIVTVVRPLEYALAKPLAEKLAAMVASYGSVTPLEQQQALLITETAGQVRRLFTIIEEIDRQDPEGAIEIFPVRHASAMVLLQPLTALLSVREVKYVINQQGQQVKLEENQMPGLNITADERTNSIIAKGTQARIDRLRDAIELLDVPAVSGGRGIRTIALEMLAPSDAAKRLTQLYAVLPEDRRPTVIPMDELGKVTIVGSDTAIIEGIELLEEIDGGGEVSGDDERRVAAIPLERAEPEALIRALEKLLNNRQVATTRLVAGPDGHSIIVSGPGADVEAIERILPVLDRAAPVDRQVRLLEITAADPEAVVERARVLYLQQTDTEDPTTSVAVDLDAAGRTVTVVGAAAALDRFASALRMVDERTVVARETRQIAVENAEPSRLVEPLASLSRQLLAPRDGRAFTAPEIEAVDPLDLLVVTAEPEHFAVIESLVGTLDEPTAEDFQFLVVPITVSEPAVLLEKAAAVYERLGLGEDPEETPMPEVELDPLAGNIIVTGRTDAVARYDRALDEARRLLPPDRSGRLLELEIAKAEDVIEPLREILATTAPPAGHRSLPDPEIEVVERTNSLYIVAESAQHEAIAKIVRQLDTFEPSEVPPLRLIQVRAADAVQLSQLLTRRYAARPAELRRLRPVEVSSDAATNTLIVTSHEDDLEEIRAFVESVNRAGEATAERETMLFPLKLARAADVARALEKLYPEPPVPLDRRGREMPHLREPREVYVSADEATNTLIIEAPSERLVSFRTLVEQLDRVELPPTAELRTYHVERGDLGAIATTLEDLSRRGVLSEQRDDGGKPVEVTIQVEPESRTLIIAGDAVTFSQTEAILADLQAVPVERTLRVFEVFGADPQEIADRAMSLYAEQTADIPDAGSVSVEVDRATAVLLVVADDESMVRFAGILDELQATVGPPPDVRLLPLEFAKATDVVEFLRDLAESHLAMVGGRAGPLPTFEAIERTNSILAAARSDQHEIIRALVQGIDRADAEMPPLRILQVRTADAQNLARALSEQYDRRPTDQRNERPVRITADAQTNALIVAAHPDLLEEVEAIVTDLNATSRMDTEGREIRIFPLKVARAEDLGLTLDEMYPEPPMPVDSRGRPMPHLKQPREVVVRADPQTNSLIVDAPVQRMAGFEQLVEQLDRAQITEHSEVRTYPIVHVELEAVARTLRELAAAGSLGAAAGDRRVPVTIATEPVSRTLVVSGPLDIFDDVERVLAELDARRAGPETSLRFFKLAHARADSVAPMMREILVARLSEEIPEAASDVESLLNVTSDRKTNTLIISAPTALMPVAEALVEQLDDATATIGDPVVRVRPLTFADATEVSSSLSGALPQMISETTGEPMDVKLVAAAGSNAIILVGLGPDLDAVEALIEPLDLRPAMDAIDARTFALEHADAPSIAPIVENLLTDQQLNDPRIIMERIRRSRGEIDLTPRISVEADDRTNSLIVSGPQQMVALAETLIEELDREDADAGRVYRTYTPRRAEAERLAQSVVRVLEAARPAGRRDEVELVAEPQSGAIVVIGTEAAAERAMALLAEWDDAALQPPALDFAVLATEHADAATVAGAVSRLLADRSRWPAELQALARAGLPVGQPTITAEPGTNRLLVSAPRELIPVARDLVAELDRPRAGAGALDVRVFALTSAEATDVADALRSVAEARHAAAPARPAPSITAEPSTNAVVVTAAPEDIEAMEAIVAELDQGMAADQPQVRTIFLRYARAETVAPIVEQLLQGEQLPLNVRVEAIRRRIELPDLGADVRVAADPRLNAVVVSAPPASLHVAEELVQQLDVDPDAVASGAARSVRVLVIENAEAPELAATLEALFDDPDELDAPPTIRVDAASNSLVVRATSDQFETIRSVVEGIDRATIATSRQMRLIPVDPARASAREVADALRRMIDRGGESRVEVITLDELLERREERGGDGDDAGLDDAS